MGLMRDRYERSFVVLCVLLVIGTLGFVVYGWHVEAATFNRYKKPEQPKATWVDAAFSELRVEAGN
jgi:uncharacterized membrane protein YsdA (DUF1294 family)